MQQINDSSSIEEVLYYIVSTYGKEIYKDKQRLSNLISDLYTGDERLKRVYRRAIIEDALAGQLYALSLKPIKEREAFYNQLVSQFVEMNFYEEVFGKKVIETFVAGMNLEIVEPISTEATEEDGEWIDEFGAKYSADRKKLIQGPIDFEDYSIREGTIIICDRAFGEYDDLTHIEIPNSVTHIGNEAFWSCCNLTYIEIPNNVICIGEKAFSYCDLTDIRIPDSVTLIKDKAFSDCCNLTDIIVSKKNKSYKSINGVLYSYNLKQIICYPEGKEEQTFIIPDSVTDIGDAAFKNCWNLTNIKIPNSVTYIGKEAFENCDLTDIKIPNSVTHIGDGAFIKCENLIVQENNKAYKSIDGVLYTYNLQQIICYPQRKEDQVFNIPNSVTNIGNKAFCYCSNLRNIVIPNSVINIGDGAFYACENLTNIVIPNSVTNIGNKAFYYCSNLRKIVISNSVTNIEDRVFGRCKNLIQIAIPNSVTNIKNEAFYRCEKLTNIVIPNSVTTIGDGAFRYCKNLTNIVIPNSVINVGNEIFANCWNLANINVQESNRTYKSIDGVLYTYNLQQIILYPQGKKEQVFIIPNKVKNIGNRAFYRCEKLTNIVIPNSVTNIGDEAFSGCENLTSIIIPNNVINIGNRVFSFCTNLTNIMISNNVTNIGYQAFTDCPNLTTFLIPNSVTNIGDGAFIHCKKLTDIIVQKNNNTYKSFDDILYSYNLQQIICYPDGKKERLFIIPNSVTHIGAWAFGGDSLTSIVIPNSVTNIGKEAFENCENLTSIIISKGSLSKFKKLLPKRLHILLKEKQ